MLNAPVVVIGKRTILLLSPFLLIACHKDAPPDDQGTATTGAPAVMPRPRPAPSVSLITLKPRAGEIVVAGAVTAANPSKKTFNMEVSSISLPPGQVMALDVPRPKTVTLTRALIHAVSGTASMGELKPGLHVEAVGKDLGKGSKLPAREIVMGTTASSTIQPPIPTPVAPGPNSGYPNAPSASPGGYPPPPAYPGAPSTASPGVPPTPGGNSMPPGGAGKRGGTITAD